MDKPPATPAPDAAFADAQAMWNRRFGGSDYLFGTDPNAWLRRHAGLWAPGQRVLAVADGEGRNSVWLARQGLQVEAFDIAEAALAKARALAARHGVSPRFVHADVDGYAWPREAFAGVAAIFVQFASPPVRQRLFARIVDALAPGGWLVLQGYTPRQLDYGTGGPPQPEHLYTPALLRQAFEGPLTITELIEYEDVLQEGSGHAGRSALVGLVARKPA